MRCAYCTLPLSYATATRVLPMRALQPLVADFRMPPTATITERIQYVCSEDCGAGLIERQQNEDLAEAIAKRWELSEFAVAQMIHLIREHRAGWTRR